MAELVDALGLGSSEVIRGGSSPLTDIDTTDKVVSTIWPDRIQLAR